MKVKIHTITMPKWGLTMEEGTIAFWLIEEGDRIAEGMEILEVETDKIVQAVESAVSGVLRRKIGKEEKPPFLNFTNRRTLLTVLNCRDFYDTFQGAILIARSNGPFS